MTSSLNAAWPADIAVGCRRRSAFPEETDVLLKLATDRAGIGPCGISVQLSDAQRGQLIASLLKVGWTRRGAFIVAPDESLCLPLALMHTGELGEFRDRIEQRCVSTDSTPAPAETRGDLVGTLEVLRAFLATLAPAC